MRMTRDRWVCSLLHLVICKMATLNSLSVGSEFHVFECCQEANVCCVRSGMGHLVPSLRLDVPSVALQAMTQSVHDGAVDSSNTNTKRQSVVVTIVDERNCFKRL